MTYEHETFPRAPIVEALLDIRVTPESRVDLAILDKFATAVAPQFPKKETRYSIEGAIKINFEPRAHSVQTLDKVAGYLCRSEDNTKIVQGRVDGFSFSQLTPYRDWPTLRDESSRLWSLYKEIVRPLRVTGLALRYINRIEIPLPFGDFRDYILTHPEIAPGVPQGIAEFFFRVLVPDSDTDCLARISSTIDKPTEDQKALPYIFDIDAFQIVDLAPDSSEIWQVFEALRNYKNKIFFCSITEKTRGLFR